MNNLTEAAIKRLANNESTYMKGLRYFKMGNVIEFKKLDSNTTNRNDLYFYGKVLGVHDVYNVSIKLTDEGELITSACDCPAYYTSIGICKHITAVLLHIKEYHFHDDHIEEDIHLLVNQYKRKPSLHIPLIPTMIFKDSNVGIELKVGDNRPYVIKDIRELFRNIENQQTYEYGKSLSFTHTMEAFDSRSQKLLALIKDDAYSREPVSYYYSNFDNKRSLQLGELNFEKILELYAGELIPVKIDNNEAQYQYELGNPPLRLFFKDGKLRLENEDFTILELRASSYLFLNNHFYCLNNLTNPKILPLIKQLMHTEYVQIDTSTSGPFFTYIYPQIQDAIEIEGKEQLEALNNVKPLNIQVYLDLKDGILYLKYKFFYGTLEKDEAILQNEFIHEEEEQDFINTVLHFGFDPQTFTLEDEDAIYRFLLEDLPKLKEIAEIFIGDSIKNMSIRAMKQPQIGVRFDNNFLEVTFNDLDFDVSELDKVLKAYQMKKKYYKLKDGTLLTLNETYLNTLDETLDSLNISPKKVKEVNEVETYKMVKLQSVLDRVNLNHQTKQFIHDLKYYDQIEQPLEKPYTEVLRDYQKTGYRWLANLSHYHLGGILADDMGLGKTLQIITLLAHDTADLPSLVVTPASLIFNWDNEIKKFAPDLKSIIIEGLAKDRKECIEQINGKAVVITSYDYLKRDVEFYQDKKFRFVVIDEAQNIKNFNTKNAQSVKSINAEVRFALTGTPIENTLADLWSIFDYILPGYFKTYQTFKYDYETEIVKNQNEELLGKLTKQIAPFILRRSKKEVLKELPPKVEQVIYAKMDEEQTKVYQAMLHQAKQKIVDPNASKFVILSYLTKLRQICCDPHLIFNSYYGTSAKLDLTIQVIEDSIAAGHKILLFSQFTSMLAIIAKKLEENSVPYLLLTGDTPTKDRPNLVDTFNSDEKIPIFLISLKAGGLGLNLTSADTIIHYDPWWNVSAENQASDRAHRIGQTKTVQVLKVIIKNTIEEKILQLQDKKRKLVEQVISDDDQFMDKLSYHELLSLFE